MQSGVKQQTTLYSLGYIQQLSWPEHLSLNLLAIVSKNLVSQICSDIN